MESLRKDAVVHEFDTIRELEFPSASEDTLPRAEPAASERPSILPLVLYHRRLLYRVAARSIVISAIIAFLLPHQFESTVSIMPPESIGGGGNMLAALAAKASPGLAALAGNMFGISENGALFVGLLRSRTVQDHIVDRFNLQRVYWSRYKQDACKTLNRRTAVEEDRKSGVISVTVTDESPQRAHDIAQAYIEELDRLVSQVSTSSARRERMFIEQRLTSVKSDLEDAEKQFSVFASKNTALDIKEQTKAMVDSAAMLQGQMIAAESELQGLEQIYNSNNVHVRALKARVDELKLQLQKLGGTDASLLTDASPSDELYPSIRKLPLLGVEWADLYRRMKVQETVFELLNQQYELARIQEAKEIPTVNVIDSANLPERKSSPHRLLIILAITAIAIAGAVAWITAMARLDRLDPQDPRKIFAIGASQRIQDVRARCAQNAFVARMARYARPVRWLWNFGKA
jgi:capsule polysaccharide export protein KpsE/RkpR